MFVIPSAQPQHAFVDPAPSLRSSSTLLGTSGSEATSSLLSTIPRASMERTAAAPEYQQSGLPSPYPSNYGDNQSEASSADHASAAQYAATNQSEVRTNNYPAAATPTSEYSTYPASARSSSFPEHIQRPYHPAAASTHSGSSAGMAQQNSPSQPHHHLPAPPELPASSSVSSEATLAPRVLGSSGSAGGGAANSSSSSGSTHLLQQQPSPPPAQQYRLQPRLVDTVPPPIDPSLPAPSPTFQYPPQHSPYGPPPHSAASHQSTPNSADMAHGGYSHHPAANPGGMYAQPRPDWSSYNQHPPLTPNHPIFPPTPTHAQPPARSQTYSFVPIPGAQQHKRPRRRYEEIERMYKCGWQGCEKAYGTLNHLNAHVTMQSHGLKRTPEEFKEIRREWKARRKEEEAQRKAEEERQRQAAASAAATAHANGQGTDGPAGAPGEPGPAGQYAPPRNVQLPPIGYQPNQYPTPSSAGAPPPNLSEYPPASGHMYQGTGYQQPPSPYAAPPSGGQIYNQRR